MFIVCLSLLISIHELGHLAAAKAFKVYCFEYSIGFGPKIFSKKRKNGETYFSIRAIPFGGYVSMFGEGSETPEGLEIPPERRLDNIKKWKRAIVLVAGVTMNMVLALLIFFISDICFPRTEYYVNVADVGETTILETSSLKTGDMIVIYDLKENPSDENSQTKYYALTKDAILTYEDNSTLSGLYGILDNQLANNKDLDWKYFLHFVSLDENNNIVKSYEPTDTGIIKFDFHIEKIDEVDEEQNIISTTFIGATLNVILDEQGNRVFENTGLSIYKDKYYLGGKAFGEAFVDVGESSTAIIRAFGSLFTSQEARDSMGGIIAIGFESTNILRNFGFDYFLRLWGMISVNLAIINLLPFPGLDGWQLLVLIVEGVSHKKIPDKVKNIISLVGLALLFGLMILLVFKDVFKYIV